MIVNLDFRLVKDVLESCRFVEGLSGHPQLGQVLTNYGRFQGAGARFTKTVQ